jgi:hypothetical protein
LEPTGWRLPQSASVVLGSKAGNVVVFLGKAAFLEPADEVVDFFTGKGGFLEQTENVFMGARAFLEPTEQGSDFFTGVLVFWQQKQAMYSSS